MDSHCGHHPTQRSQGQTGTPCTRGKPSRGCQAATLCRPACRRSCAGPSPPRSPSGQEGCVTAWRGSVWPLCDFAPAPSTAAAPCVCSRQFSASVLLGSRRCTLQWGAGRPSPLGRPRGPRMGCCWLPQGPEPGRAAGAPKSSRPPTLDNPVYVVLFQNKNSCCLFRLGKPRSAISRRPGSRLGTPPGPRL